MLGFLKLVFRRRLLEHLSDEQNPDLRIQLRMFGELIHFSIAFTEDPERTLALETELNSRMAT